MSFSSHISGFGHAVPERIVTNQELSEMIDTSDEWIVERTGIAQRHIASDEESSATLGTIAAERALKKAGIKALDLDLIITATCTPSGMFPSTASRIQHAIGASCGAFDINAACNGFVTALSTAAQLIHSRSAEKILIIGSEVLSRITDWSDRGTCILFGDGAGAVILERNQQNNTGQIFRPVLGSDGGAAELLFASGPCTAPSDLLDQEAKIVMDGRAVFKYAVTAMAEAVEKALEEANLKADDIDICVPHQANKRIIKALMERLGLPLERAFVNLQKYGNTSSASIPIALSEALDEKRVKSGDMVLFVAFGGGLNWGAMLAKWG
jgi:3-oxoacyl-[acyl-carrier-protein] synthase-3